ncbi:MAG TPA: hypothetical protein ENI62_09595 [Gammaproteobacteria bacterium]|nr:hypothetical protein [Gammaproteobacteria bacterium]
MWKINLLFCVGVLTVSVLVAAFAIPYASLSDSRLALSKSVVAAEDLGSVDLGEFGQVSVSELAAYYVENPPAQQSNLSQSSGAERKVHFEGC